MGQCWCDRQVIARMNLECEGHGRPRARAKPSAGLARVAQATAHGGSRIKSGEAGGGGADRRGLREAGEPSPANRVIHHPSPRPARTSYFSKPAHRIAHRRVERRPGSIVTTQLSLPRPSSALPLGARDPRPAQSRDHSRSRDRCDGRGIRGDCVSTVPPTYAYGICSIGI